MNQIWNYKITIFAVILFIFSAFVNPYAPSHLDSFSFKFIFGYFAPFVLIGALMGGTIDFLIFLIKKLKKS